MCPNQRRDDSSKITRMNYHFIAQYFIPMIDNK